MLIARVNKLKINEIAKAYGVTKSAVEKWSPTKRQQASRLLSAGVNPQIMELVGEVQRLCYAATKVIGENVVFRPYAVDCGYFQVFYHTHNGNELERHDIMKFANDMTAESLNLAITKLESIINAK